jgi:hypothetical protein
VSTERRLVVVRRFTTDWMELLCAGCKSMRIVLPDDGPDGAKLLLEGALEKGWAVDPVPLCPVCIENRLRRTPRILLAEPLSWWRRAVRAAAAWASAFAARVAE